MSAPVYRAIIPRDLTLGVPREIFLYLIAGSIIIVASFSQYWFIPFAIALFIMLRVITKVDEYLPEILMRHVAQPNRIEV